MQQVVDEAGLDWLETPDQAVVWGTALGLQHEIEGVLDSAARHRGLQTAGLSGRVAVLPDLVHERRAGPRSRVPRRRGSGGGLFSNSGIPDLGGMMSALGTIGNSPSSSGGQRRRRVLRRIVGRRWRRRGRRLLAAPGLDGPEHLPARLETLDLDLGPRAGTPDVGGHAEPLRIARHALRRDAAETVLLVPERAGNRVRGRIVEEGLGQGDLGAQAVERERRGRPRASPCRSPGPGTHARATTRC